MSRRLRKLVMVRKRSRELGRAMFHSAQAAAPEWPVMVLWMFLRYSVAAAARRVRRGKRAIPSTVGVADR